MTYIQYATHETITEITSANSMIEAKIEGFRIKYGTDGLFIEVYTNYGTKVTENIVVMYRAYTAEDKWLPWVSNADPEWMESVKLKYNIAGDLDKTPDGFAGIDGHNIKAVEIRLFEEESIYFTIRSYISTGGKSIFKALVVRFHRCKCLFKGLKVHLHRWKVHFQGLDRVFPPVRVHFQGLGRCFPPVESTFSRP